MRAANNEAVETAIALMHANVASPLRLHELADAAYLSRFHFDRVFRTMTGVSAVAFAAALRIDAAKRLLVNGEASVTEACYALGYESLGSFVSRFSRSVGVSPGALRASSARDDGTPVVRDAEPRVRLSADGCASIGGIVSGDVPADLVVWVGAFSRGIPDGLPAGGTLLHGVGPFRIDGLSCGTYHILALGVPRATSLRGYLALGASARVGKGGAVVLGPAGADRRVTIDLAVASVTDPPILVALPLVTGDGARSE